MIVSPGGKGADEGVAAGVEQQQAGADSAWKRSMYRPTG